MRAELGAFGDAARNDGGNGGSEGQQKEELDQVITVLGGQLLGPHKESGAVGHAVAHHKINHGGHRKIHQDFDQRVDLVLFANRAQLQKCKTGVHGQHHDAAQQNKKRICALFQCFHDRPSMIFESIWCILRVIHPRAPNKSKKRTQNGTRLPGTPLPPKPVHRALT